MSSPPPQAAQRYQHRPKPFSNALELGLGARALSTERGARRQEYPLAEIELIRLAYRPANTQRRGFSCYLRMRDQRSLRFTNLDWRSLVENARQDAPYASFVQALVAQAAQANPKIALRAGLPAWRYRLFGLGAMVMLLALAAGAAYFVLAGHWPLAAFAAGLLLWCAIHAREYRQRNLPRTFAPDRIPREVLPSENLLSDIQPSGISP